MTTRKENYFLSQLKHEKLNFLISSVLAALGAGLGVVPYYLVYEITCYFYFDGQAAKSVEHIVYLVLAGVAAVCLKAVCSGISGHISHQWSYRVLFNIRVTLADKWSRLHLGYFNRNSVGELKKIIHEDVEALEQGLAHAVPDLVSALTVPLFTAVLMFCIDWRMALSVVSFVPVVLVLYGLTYAPSRERIREFQDAMSEVNRVVVQYLQGMKVIKIFTRSDASLTEFIRVTDRFTEMIKRFSTGAIHYIALLNIAIRANVVVILPVGTWLYVDGSLELPAFVFFLLIGLGFNLPFMKLATTAGQVLQPVMDAGKRINRILQTADMVTGQDTAPPAGTEIQFRHVGFSYDTKAVLENISFTLKENTVTALVGPSGAGKSTIAQLIPRFWDVGEGEIRLDGRNIKSYAMDTLMSSVSFVFQDPFLFNDTVYQNILLGNPEADREDVFRAARLARADEFIEKLPQRYNTPVGERGDRLSGGQKQRIVLARAILKNAPVLILDEATSFIDPYCEVRIQKAIGELVRDKTVLVIAHHLSTAVHADQILVVNEGRIQARGRHEDLLRTSRLYQRMWRSYQWEEPRSVPAKTGNETPPQKSVNLNDSTQTDLLQHPCEQIAGQGLWGMMTAMAGSRKNRFKRGLFFHFIENMVSGVPVIFTYLVILELLGNTLQPHRVWQYMGVITGTFAIQGLFHYLGAKDLWQVHAEAPGELKKQIGVHLKKLPLGFYSRNDTGGITTLLTNDIQTLNLITTPTQLVRVASSTLITGIILVLIDWRLGLVTLSSLPFAFLALSWGDKVFADVWKAQTDSRSAANSVIIEYLQGIKVIRSLNLSGTRFAGFIRQMKQYRDTSINTAVKLTPSVIVFGILLELGFVATLGMGAFFHIKEYISFQIFLFYLFVGLFFYIPFSELADITAYRRVLQTSMKRIRALLNTPVLAEPAKGKVPEGFDIALENVSFSYDTDKVLKDVSFSIPANKITALVGPSGSGKTTVTNLVARFWDPDRGQVKLGGIDIREIPSNSLLSNISMVFQDVYLFRDTVFENVRLGNADASDEEVVRVCRLARCHQFISRLPQGYHTLVGEGGSTLSGGEKQRISIARALLKNSPVLLLDEATASIDPENERLIQEVLNELMHDKTILIIAHRLSTVRAAAKIVVLQNGQVVQEGDHTSLYPEEGIYRSFWLARKQAAQWAIR